MAGWHLLLEPLGVVLHFTGVETDWLFPTIDEVVWRQWPVDGEQVWMAVTRRKGAPEYEGTQYQQFAVGPRETVADPFEMTVAILLVCRQETRDRLRVEVICFMDYAVEMYHQLVERLWEVHGSGKKKPAEAKETQRVRLDREKEEERQKRALWCKELKDRQPQLTRTGFEQYVSRNRQGLIQAGLDEAWTITENTLRRDWKMNNWDWVRGK